MNLRDIAVGAVSTILATVFSAIIVFEYTDLRMGSERSALTYFYSNSLQFSSNNNNIGTSNVTIINSTNELVENLQILIEFFEEINVNDIVIDSSAGELIRINSIEFSENIVKIAISELAVDEVVDVSILLGGIGSFRPSVSVRGDGVIGTFQDPGSDLIDRVKIWYIPIFIMVMIVIAFAVQKLIKSILNLYEYAHSSAASFNNSAFVFLHNRRYEESKVLLDAALTKRGFGFYEMANYALYLGLTGESKASNEIFMAAEKWAATKSQQALIEFNKSVLDINDKELHSAYERLSKAMKLSKQEIRKYCRISDFILEGRKDSDDIKNLTKFLDNE